MSYDRAHILLTWGGTLPGDEEWTCGIRLASKVSGGAAPSEFDQEQLTSYMGVYVPEVQGYHQRQTTGINGRCGLTWVKAAAIGLDGKYLYSGASMVLNEFPSMGGVVSGLVYPNQIALAVTTKTEVTRGLAKQGRFFLPMVTFPVQPDGLISAADADGLRSSTKTFIEAISDVPGIDGLLSPGASVMSKVGSGATNRINGIGIGRVYDTQRRRRRSLPEKYELAVIDQGLF